MASREKVYCTIRKMWVAATPEEIIRQKLLSHMVNNLGFPSSALVLEKELRQLPHLALSPFEIPQRRADAICFAPGIHSEHALYPLLLIECKAVELNQKVLDQIIGYNHIIQAKYICLANALELKTGWLHHGQYTFIDHLPTYQSLLKN